jgi:hypothetical protein
MTTIPETTGGVGSTSVPGATECGCLRCQDERRQALPPEAIMERFPGMDPHFRYACEICGNKRCPHHTDHRLACSGSNAVGQPGSAYQ